MGKVLFLNEQAKKYHEEQGIVIKNPQIRLVVDNGPVKLKAQKARKPKRKTLGQRIYENLQNNGDFNDDPKDYA